MDNCLDLAFFINISESTKSGNVKNVKSKKKIFLNMCKGIPKWDAYDKIKNASTLIAVGTECFKDIRKTLNVRRPPQRTIALFASNPSYNWFTSNRHKTMCRVEGC